MKYFNVHYGRENLNKEKYMFDIIKSTEGRVILLVPDQFTLQAEKEAFFYLETKGLMDIEVLSLTRLGTRILAETGGSGRAPIDASGRFMVIAKLAAENRDKLKLFKNSSKGMSFARMANDLIYEMKQYDASPLSLAPLIESMGAGSILRQKLEDISLLYGKYEEYTAGKYLDGEDYLALFTSKIKESELVRESAVWIYGFDYFTPKNMALLKALTLFSRETNILATYGDESKNAAFELTGGVISKIKKLAEENGAGFKKTPVPDAYLKGAEEKTPALSVIEKELFSIPAATCPDSEGVTLLKSANPYSEIESAAAYVLELVRDNGLTYKDIAVICNDMGERARIARRIFSEYGIDVFIDQKRSFTQSPAVRFILALLCVVINKYRSHDIFSLLKTGMSDIPPDRYEELENYAIKYKIKGNRWKKEFLKGGAEYGEAFAEIENSRAELFDFISAFEEPFSKQDTVRQMVETLYIYLNDTARIPWKLEKIEALEMDMGLPEYAEETAQTWKGIVNIFDQLVEIMGDEVMNPDEFAEVLRVGFESAEVGVLPPAADGLIFGTMQRIRLGRIKALVIIGANDGLLPAASAKEGLISDDEKNLLFAQNAEICRREELRLGEERIAIYKNMSKPEKYLWMSCSVSDNDGGKLNPSTFFEKIGEIFPNLTVQSDIISRNDRALLIQSKESTIIHMAGGLRESIAYEKMPDPEWLGAAGWFRKNDNDNFNMMLDGLFFENRRNRLEAGSIEGLYKKIGRDMTLSPSRIEKFGNCPFAFFVAYGLSPDEQRIFEVAGREIGDIYHNCLMRFSKTLTDGSRWGSVTREETSEMTARFIEEEAGVYKEGMLTQGSEEIYRTQRMKEVCGENAWRIVEHVRRGNISGMRFEEKFGQSALIPPIAVPIGGEKKVFIEGKIDRVDILADGSVKIIDYKSGREKFNIAEAKAGMRLQLMLYLRAAQNQKSEPAGVFYYIIDEKAETGKMDGVVVDKPSVIHNIAGDFEGYSDVIPIRRLKDGRLVGSGEGYLLSEEEFKELQKAVDKKVEELCGGLVGGCIDIRPKRSGDRTACKYCGYKSLCMFDVAFDGCRYENV